MSRRLLSLLLCLLVPRAAGLAQSVPSPNAAQPAFRSSVDLLTLEASVRDRKGQPVSDLRAADFTVTIDGRPRRVVSAAFFKADESGGTRISGGSAPTPAHQSNDRATPGRVVIFAIDAQTIRKGQQKVLLDTASRMLDRLSPADAVGLVEFPGPAIDVTRDHSRVRDALLHFSGRAREEMEEAAVQAGGKFLVEATERAHTQQVLLDLAALVRRMAPMRAPRSVILISGGLVPQQELMSDYNELQRAVAEARVTIYPVLLEQVGYDVSRGEFRPDAAVDPGKAEGLATIASRTGGMFFTGIAGANGIFDRIASEVTSFYQLGVEGSPADADGKQHDVKVKVAQAGLDVRALTHLATAKPPSKPLLRDPLASALQQPTDVADVPLAVATYSTHAEGGAVRVVISAEVGAPGGAAPAEWAFAISDKGNVVASARARLAAGSASPRVVSTSVEVPPGKYRLRVAAADAADRTGVLEIPFTAGYETAGDAVLSDLIVGAVTDGRFEPRRHIAQSEQIVAMFELRGGSGATPAGTLQLIRAGSARSVVTIPLSSRPPDSAQSPATFTASAPLANVPPGRYTARAALQIGGQPLADVSRIVEITEPAAVTTAPAATPASAPETIVPAPAAKVTPSPAGADASARVADEIMRRVGAYVEHYGGQASLLVGVERYSQSLGRPLAIQGIRVDPGSIYAGRDRPELGLVDSQNRRLVSEFALVANASTSGGWLGFRDVMEIDGKRIPDRSNRLTRLFQSGAPDVEAARRIADESARYNIGPVSRNFNLPTTTLFFFHSGNLARFTFRRSGQERIEGVDAAVIDFREERSPTLTMNRAGQDVPGSGTLWVNPADGTVLRTRLEFRGFDDSGSRAVIEVTYRKDPALALWVPSRMTERYSGGTGSTATTVATYSEFKRFQTTVRIK